MNKITVKKKMWNTLIAAAMDMHQRPSKTVLYKKCYFKKNDRKRNKEEIDLDSFIIILDI